MTTRNCPNCIYNYEMKPSDSVDCINVFCKACGHWLDWNLASNCTDFIAKESAAHMNLDGAIAHYKAQADNDCDAEQLVLWLTELQMLRKHTSLTEVERNAVNNYNLHHFKIVFALLKSMWADQNASNEEVRFPKLAECWKARAKKYRESADHMRNPEDGIDIDTSWVAHMLINEYDDGLNEAVDEALLITQRYVRNHPEE